MSNIVFHKKLIKVSAKDNNNKFWNVEAYDNGTIKREWGRVNYGTRKKEESKPNAKHEAEKLYKSKIKDGYKEITILDDKHIIPQKTSIKEAALSQIAKDKSDDVKKLINELIDANIHNILSNTTLSYNQNSGLFSTPLGVVDQNSVDKAKIILKQISDKIQNSNLDENWSDLCEEYLTIIPHGVGSKLDLKLILGTNDLILKEQNILKSLEASIEMILKDNKNSINEKIFDVDIEIVTNPEIISYVQQKFERNIYKNHPSSHLKVKRVFDLNIKSMTKKFIEKEKEIENMRKLWHGTRAGNLLSILHKGMIIPDRYSSIVTGRMFGNGLYFSDVSTKALNYSYGSWNKNGLSKKNVYYALICNVLLGKEFLADKTSFQDNNYYPKSGYDSTFAKSGTLNLLNNEMIVYNANQVSPRYIVEFE